MTKKIYLIAGEASGDFIGAKLMSSLKQQHADIELLGVGGPLMEQDGLSSLFPMNELSLMGVFEILPKLPQLIKRINQTIAHIEENKPDIIITIDAPDFSFRVQRKIKQRAKILSKQVHYVAPTVWAWRPKRAGKIAKFLEAIICLFDFEPSYFEKEGLLAISAGHPMMESGIEQADALRIGKVESKKIGLFLGSRQGELKRTAPEIIDAAKIIEQKIGEVEFIIPTLPHLTEQIKEMMRDIQSPVHIVAPKNTKEKWSLFQTCNAAIAVSGTVGLELAANNVPHVIAYKVNRMTFEILKRVIKTPYAHLANIILHKEIVPEFIQEDATAQNISSGFLEILLDKQKQESQKAAFDIVRKKIGAGENPSTRAAEFILSL